MTNRKGFCSFYMSKDSLKEEIEFKWNVRSPWQFKTFLKKASDLGIKIGRPVKIPIQDTYLETKDHFFSNSGIKCRIRRANGRWELTMKSSSRLKRGLARRQEKNINLPGFDSKPEAIDYCERQLLSQVLRGRKLTVLFQIKNRRTSYQMDLPQNTRTEVSFDQTVISKKGHRSKKLMEIELEWIRGSLQEFEAFVRRISKTTDLKPSKCSKVATALKAFDLKLPYREGAGRFLLLDLVKTQR